MNEVIIYLVALIAGFVLAFVTRWLWVTRRPVPRKNVPTGKEPWVTPKPWRDDTPVG